MALITLYRPDGEIDEFSEIPTWTVKDGYLTFVDRKGTPDARQIVTTLPFRIDRVLKPGESDSGPKVESN
jgi:hypothetical protein